MSGVAKVLTELGFKLCQTKPNSGRGPKIFFIIQIPDSALVTTYAIDEIGNHWKIDKRVESELLQEKGFADMSEYVDLVLSHSVTKQ